MDRDEVIALLPNWLGALAMAAGAAQLDAVAGFRSDSDAAALLTIANWPATTVGELAGVLGLTHSAAVRVADRLAAQGLVRRGHARGGDQRHVGLTVTELGEGEAGRVNQARLAALGDMASALDDDEREQLARLIHRALRGVPRARQVARWTCRYCDHGACTGDVCPVGSSVASGSVDGAR